MWGPRGKVREEGGRIQINPHIKPKNNIKLFQENLNITYDSSYLLSSISQMKKNLNRGSKTFHDFFSKVQLLVRNGLGWVQI